MNCPNCKTEIDEHEASRCLDAWVAKAVMGEAVLKFDEYLSPYSRYSTDIAAAWEVHRAACGWLFSKRRKYLYALEEEIRGEGPLVAWPDALIFLDEVAICRAALKAGERQ